MARATSVRVTRGARGHTKRNRNVCVEAWLSTGAIVIYLFHQDDGTWNVLPPDAERPTMTQTLKDAGSSQ